MKRIYGWMGVFLLGMMCMATVPAAWAEGEDQTVPVEVGKVLNDISGHWAKTSIETAVKKGYVKGYPDGTFKPNQQVARAEFVKMLADALHLQLTAAADKWYTPYEVALKDAALLREGDLGSDLTKPMSRLEMAQLLVRGADDSVRGTSLTDGEWLYRVTTAGLMNGTTDGTLNEQGTTTRAEATVVIERLFQKRAGETLPTDRNAIQNAAILWKGTNVEEAWGIKAVSLPYKYEIGSAFDAYLDKMIIVDLDDKNAPLRKSFVSVTSATDRSVFKGNAYLVALHFNLTKKVIEKGFMSFNGSKIGPGTDDTNFHWAYFDQMDKTMPSVPYIDMESKVKQYDGWYFLAVNKDVFVQNPNKKRVLIFNAFKQEYTRLAE